MLWSIFHMCLNMCSVRWNLQELYKPNLKSEPEEMSGSFCFMRQKARSLHLKMQLSGKQDSSPSKSTFDAASSKFVGKCIAINWTSNYDTSSPKKERKCGSYWFKWSNSIELRTMAKAPTKMGLQRSSWAVLRSPQQINILGVVSAPKLRKLQY